MKYIIKNCENCFFRGDDGHFCEFNNEYTMFVNPCENSTCFIKKVVERLKKETDPTQDQWTREKENLAKEILQMFEIEEVG